MGNKRTAMGSSGQERESNFTGPARGSDDLSRHHGQSHGRDEAHRSPRLSERTGASGTDCIFCRIARKELPTELMHEDDQCVAFRDVNPQAPVHWLIVPKRHVERLHDLTEADRSLLGHLMLTARSMAERAGVGQGGYRLVVNNGPDGGQTVPHLHLHLVGGRAMRWPPG